MIDMELTLGYGRGTVAVEIPDQNLLQVLLPRKDESDATAGAIIEQALAAPYGSRPLEDIVQPGQRIAVIISDVTRPCPSYLLLPPLLHRLEQAGVAPRNVTIISGLGSHRRQTTREHKKLVGDEVYAHYSVEDSVESGFVTVGASSRGTPFQVCKKVVEADVRIALGNIDYHYFAGYSGGAKAIMPGVCTRQTIEANHTMMLEEGATVGNLQHNPVREDIEEILQFISLDFILNVVLNEKKQVVGAVSGDAVAAHRVGCRLLDDLYKYPIDQLADIVITSPGGLPKDINVYQAQKALDNAKWAVKEGGVIIWVSECGEGYGEETFAQWLDEATCPEDLLGRIRREFRLGGHKAAAIAAVADRYDIFLVSSLSPTMADRLYTTPYPTAQAAMDAALMRFGREATVYAMPVGGTTLPSLQR